MNELGRWWFDIARDAWAKRRGYVSHSAGAARPTREQRGVVREGWRRFYGPEQIRKAEHDMGAHDVR